jgi:hypothetical protein
MEEQVISPAVPEKQKVDKLALVKAGMEVYDRAGKKVGKIDSMFGGSKEAAAVEKVVVPAPVTAGGQQPVPLAFPIVEPAEPVAANSVTVPEFDTVLYRDEDMPKELRERLEYEGFIRIDAGFFRHHRYAMREQIDRVEGQRVILNVPEDELIKH